MSEMLKQADPCYDDVSCYAALCPAVHTDSERRKAAAKLWKIVRESTREKVYTHDLLNELNIL